MYAILSFFWDKVTNFTDSWANTCIQVIYISKEPMKTDNGSTAIRDKRLFLKGLFGLWDKG